MRNLIYSILVCVLAACNLGPDTDVAIEETIVVTQAPITANPTEVTNLPTDTATPQQQAAQPTSAQRETNEPCGSPVNWVPYTVQAGDTLFSISQQVNVNIDQLVASNCLESADNITVGQTLYLPEALAERIGTSGFIRYWMASSNAVTDESQPIACETYMTPITTNQQRTDDPVSNIEAGLNTLFSTSPQAPYRSYWEGLMLDDVSLGANGTLNVTISGDFLLGGVCSDPELIAQLLLIIFAEEDVETALIMVDGMNLAQISDMSGSSGADAVFTENSIPLLDN